LFNFFNFLTIGQQLLPSRNDFCSPLDVATANSSEAVAKQNKSRNLMTSCSLFEVSEAWALLG